MLIEHWTSLSSWLRLVWSSTRVSERKNPSLLALLLGMCSKYTITISVYTHLLLCPSKSGSNWSSSLLLLSQSVLSLLWFIYFCRKAKQGKVEATESNLARPIRMTHSLQSPWGRPCKHYTWRPSERQTGPLSCEVVVFCCWWSRIFCLQAEGKALFVWALLHARA